MRRSATGEREALGETPRRAHGRRAARRPPARGEKGGRSGAHQDKAEGHEIGEKNCRVGSAGVARREEEERVQNCARRGAHTAKHHRAQCGSRCRVAQNLSAVGTGIELVGLACAPMLKRNRQSRASSNLFRELFSEPPEAKASLRDKAGAEAGERGKDQDSHVARGCFSDAHGGRVERLERAADHLAGVTKTAKSEQSI